MAAGNYNQRGDVDIHPDARHQFTWIASDLPGTNCYWHRYEGNKAHKSHELSLRRRDRVLETNSLKVYKFKLKV